MHPTADTTTVRNSKDAGRRVIGCVGPPGSELKLYMSQSTREPLSEKDQIQILLHEYGTLRTEIIHRSNNLYQLLAVGGAFFVWLMGHGIDSRFWISLALAVPLLCSGFWVIRRYTNKLSKRLREIEKRVNSLAGVELLVWETLWGAAVTRYFAIRTSPLERTADDEYPNKILGP